MNKLTNQQIADKIIDDLQKAGLTPDEMLKVIRLAREKYEAMKIADKNK